MPALLFLTSRSAAFTLLEVLMALALFAIIAAAAAPLLQSAFAHSEADQATSAMEEAALTIRGEAVRSGQRKVAELSPSGITPGAPLPPDWKLEVRRLTDSRFRKPREGEMWEFNSAGICEPITLRLSDGHQSVELRFDPLTAQTFDE